MKTRAQSRTVGLALALALSPPASSLPCWARGSGAPRVVAARAAPPGGREPSVVEQLIELLAAGTTPARSVAALAALAQFADPRSIDAVALYTGHRRPEIRLEAVRTLGAIDDPRVSAALLERLGDETPEVRAAAAEALANRGEPRALPRLMGLVKRNDPGAAAPLGRVATPEAIAQLRERQGAIADPVLATVLGAYLKRADVGDGARMDVLRSVGGLHSPESTAALREYLASIPARDDRASRREARRLLDEREADK